VSTLRRRRAARRRAAPRHRDAVAGAWDELLDRVGELGIATPAISTTRRRVAEAVDPQLPPRADGFSIATLARRTDDAVFSGRELDDAEVDAVWAEVVATVDATHQTLPWGRRTLARYRLAAATGWARRVAALAASKRPSRPRDRP
jgi:hypothetical protein